MTVDFEVLNEIFDRVKKHIPEWQDILKNTCAAQGILVIRLNGMSNAVYKVSLKDNFN